MKHLKRIDLSINENIEIDKYDFGEFTYSPGDLRIYASMQVDGKGSMSTDELDQIIETLDVCNFKNITKLKGGYITINYKKEIAKHRTYHNYMIEIFNLGDYCYSIVDTLDSKYYILDQFDSVIEKLTEIVNYKNNNMVIVDYYY